MYHSVSPTAASTAHYPPIYLEEEDPEDKVVKRQRNTMAARKYRQKKVDRMSELEKSLEDVSKERDELRIQLARREAEVEALREMLKK